MTITMAAKMDESDKELQLIMALFVKDLRKRKGFTASEISLKCDVSLKVINGFESLTSVDARLIESYLNVLQIEKLHLFLYLEKCRSLLDKRSKSWTKLLRFIMQYPDILKLMCIGFVREQKVHTYKGVTHV